MSKKKKRIKIRKTWGNINPVERIVPKKRKEDIPFKDNIYKGLKITEEDFEYFDDEFERGIK